MLTPRVRKALIAAAAAVVLLPGFFLAFLFQPVSEERTLLGFGDAAYRENGPNVWARITVTNLTGANLVSMGAQEEFETDKGWVTNRGNALESRAIIGLISMTTNGGVFFDEIRIPQGAKSWRIVYPIPRLSAREKMVAAKGWRKDAIRPFEKYLSDKRPAAIEVRSPSYVVPEGMTSWDRKSEGVPVSVPKLKEVMP